MKNKVLIILLVFVLFFSVVSFFLQKIPKTSMVNNHKKVVPTIYINPQVCTNTDGGFGFSIKYPENYKFSSNNCHYSPSYYEVEFDDGLSKDYIITINSSKSAEDITTWMNVRNICPKELSCTDPIPGPITNSVQFSAVDENYAFVDTIIKNNDAFLEVRLSSRKPKVPTSEIALQKYNDIISTITFISN